MTEISFVVINFHTNKQLGIETRTQMEISSLWVMDDRPDVTQKIRLKIVNNSRVISYPR